MNEDKCNTCYICEVCSEEDEHWCKMHNYCEYNPDTVLDGIYTSEWIIEYQKHFNNDPDEGYEEWTSEIVHCKNCGERPCADKRSNYYPNCGMKMINPS